MTDVHPHGDEYPTDPGDPHAGHYPEKDDTPPKEGVTANRGPAPATPSGR